MDFVVGIEVQLSNNHTLNGVPFYDICDELKGKYPKTFKFVGWHPSCRCHAISILKTDEEIWADDERMMNGEAPAEGSVNEVKDLPAGFKEWVDKNADRIEKAEQRGTLPYFLKDNKGKYEQYLIGNKSSANDRAIEQALGITKGKEMTFKEANELRGNPYYGTNIQYSDNCQSCVVAHELRRRGFNVQAFGNIRNEESIPTQLSKDTELAWIDPITKIKPKSLQAGGFYVDKHKIKNKTVKVMNNEFNDLTKEVGRYHMKVAWKGRVGHIFTAERLSDGQLRVYDPQTGEIVDWFRDWSKRIKGDYGVKVLKVDGLEVNASIINKVVFKSNK
jgi:hypothetical protein